MKKNTNNKFSNKSSSILDTCCLELVMTCTAVLPYCDISVVSGARGKTEQDNLFIDGKSELTFPNSLHNVGDEAGRDLSDAVDVVIYHPVYGQLWGGDAQLCRIADDFEVSLVRVRYWFYMQYAQLNMLMQVKARTAGIELRWGGDWNSENGILDQSFDDFYHWEVVRRCSQ